ncbi:MAG: hypothetical protein ACNA8N_10180 [Trueperaceae bacterium]
MTPRFEAENDFRVFLVAKDHPAGPLTLSATVVGLDGRARTQAIEVNNVPQPPSEVTVGSDGAVLGAVEADGAVSVLRLPPGAAEGETVRFDAMTQEDVKADTGVDYDDLGVTFLGAQRIGTAARFSAPLAITSGG